MTVEVILNYFKYFHNVSNHIFFYQNRFINVFVRKNFLKFSESQTERQTEIRKDEKTERRSFFVEVEELTFLIILTKNL